MIVFPRAATLAASALLALGLGACGSDSPNPSQPAPAPEPGASASPGGGEPAPAPEQPAVEGRAASGSAKRSVSFATLTGRSTTIKLHGGLMERFTELGVTFSATAPATLGGEDSRTLTLPISGGSFSYGPPSKPSKQDKHKDKGKKDKGSKHKTAAARRAGSASGSATHGAAALVLTREGKQVSLQDLRLDLSTWQLSADIVADNTELAQDVVLFAGPVKKKLKPKIKQGAVGFSSVPLYFTSQGFAALASALDLQDAKPKKKQKAGVMRVVLSGSEASSEETSTDTGTDTGTGSDTEG